jgi:hypothetical protein
MATLVPYIEELVSYNVITNSYIATLVPHIDTLDSYIEK